jgi:Domain of unknown function (DUF1906)
MPRLRRRRERFQAEWASLACAWRGGGASRATQAGGGGHTTTREGEGIFQATAKAHRDRRGGRKAKDEPMVCGTPMTSIPGGDYSVARPTVAQMKAAGWRFVCRYLRDLDKSNGDKSLSLAEVERLRAGGLEIVSNEETTGDQGLHGFAGGATDADLADRAHIAVGGPPSRPIYFSPWDHDPALLTAGQWVTIAKYLRGVASVLGLKRVGLYGGREMLTWAFDNRLTSYGWQAAGWAHNRIEPRAHIIQHVGSPIPNTDTDTAVKADYGQWGYRPPLAPESIHARGDAMILVRKDGESAVYVVASHNLIHIGTEELRAYADIWAVDETTARASVIVLPADAPIWSQLPING